MSRLGTPAGERARLLGISRTTERQYRRLIDAAGLLRGDPDEPLPELAELHEAVEQALGEPNLPDQQRSHCEPWRGEITRLHIDQGCQARAIFDRLKRKYDDAFTPSYESVKRFCRRLRQQQGIKPSQVAIPVHTAPGQVAQVDYGYLGKLIDPVTGALCKVYVFVMTLCYSRHSFVRLVTDQSLTSFVRCHVEAFEFFGGVPAEIVPDNLKSAVIKAAFGLADEPTLNQGYRALASHYKFKIDPTPPYQPQKKGKVESDVGYVKHNFYAPLRGELRDLDHAHDELRRWHEQTASVRTHGTTGQVPVEHFELDEKAQLIGLPAERYEPRVYRHVTVHRDAHVQFEGRLYSVPFQHVGQRLWLEATETTVTIHDPDYVRVATHRRHGPGRYSTHEQHLPPERRDLRRRDAGYWLERADAIDTEVGAYMRAVLASDAVLSKLRTVQAMMKTLDAIEPERAVAAVQRAQRYGAYEARRLRAIVDQGLERTEQARAPVEHGRLEQPPSFARSRAHFERATSRPAATAAGARAG